MARKVELSSRHGMMVRRTSIQLIESKKQPRPSLTLLHGHILHTLDLAPDYLSCLRMAKKVNISFHPSQIILVRKDKIEIYSGKMFWELVLWKPVHTAFHR